MQEVDLDWWMPIYRKIASKLGPCEEEDRKATAELDHLLEGREADLSELESKLSGRIVIVAGNGPSLESDLLRAMRSPEFQEIALVAADGSAPTVYALTGRVPDAIVTDLDGDNEATLILSRRGSTPVVHGHGDNIPRVRSWVPRFASVIGTTQVEPTGRVHNFGGFTDGDRAAYLACAAGASALLLAGMDLVGSSRHDVFTGKDLSRKREKLEIAAWLLELLAQRTRAPLYTLSRRARPLRGVQQIETLSELRG